MVNQKAVVVGAGLGGMSAAIRLKADGYDVTLLEKNETIGGKLNQRSGEGFTFDTGASILTIPWVLEQLFEKVNRDIHDYITIERIEPQWRTFFEDGKQMDVTSDLPTMLQEMAKVTDQPGSSLTNFLSYSQDMYELSTKSFYKYDIADLSDLKKYHSARELKQMNLRKTVAEATHEHLNNRYLEQLFNFQVMYGGSNPYSSPAVLNQLAYVQLGLGVHYVKGGMYKIAEAMGKVMDELKIDVQLETPASRLVTDGKRVTGVETARGTIEADIIVSNLEAIPAYRYLDGTKKGKKEAKQLEKKYKPTVSGLVLLLGINKQYEQLKHHNFFFSENPEKEFTEIFDKRKPAEDPSVYIGVTSKSDASQAPEEKDNLFIFTHVPSLERKTRKGWDWEVYRRTVIEKLERMGLEGLEDSIEFEYQFAPEDMEALYGADGGSIYGAVADKKSNGLFKIPARSALYSNLYFVGGSTHPGGGVPMGTLSGQLTADLIKSKQ